MPNPPPPLRECSQASIKKDNGDFGRVERNPEDGLVDVECLRSGHLHQSPHANPIPEAHTSYMLARFS